MLTQAFVAAATKTHDAGDAPSSPGLADPLRDPLSAPPVQFQGQVSGAPADVPSRAQSGLGAGHSLPHLATIQESFGSHDVTGVRAHTDGAAQSAAGSLGADGYAMGNDVVLGSTDLHTAAHEAAHVVQQASGVRLQAGVGSAGDAYEQHADAVADTVVAGGSAESLLSAGVGGGNGGGTGLQFSLKGDFARVFPRMGRGERKALKDTPVKTTIERELTDTGLTDTGKTPADEIRDALFVATANDGSEDAVAGLKQELMGLWKSATTTDGNLEQIAAKTNAILAASGVNAQHGWKLDMEYGDVTTEQGGAASWATVGVRKTDNVDEVPTPHKLQVSLDRHLTQRMRAGIASKAQNSMLVEAVHEGSVLRDLATIGAEYKTKVEADDTGDYLSKPAGGRHYWVERLHAVEPHLYPKAGDQVVALTQAEHAVIKEIRGPAVAKDTKRATWVRLCQLVRDSTVTFTTVKAKLIALGIPVPAAISGAADSE
jgi:hypothetical protein